MSDSDMLVLGFVLSLKNNKWKDAMLERVRSKFVGATTTTSKITRSSELLKDD